MAKNPFNNKQSEEPTFLEKMEVRHAMLDDNLEQPNIDQEWGKLSQRISSEAPATHHIFKRMLTQYGKVACITLLLIAGVTFIFLHIQHSGTVTDGKFYKAQKEVVSEITLSLDNGDATPLADTVINFNQAATLTHTTVRSVKMVSIATTNGKNCHITLPDGSQVWLNANSKIDFPERFLGKERSVHIEGEAYFDVIHNPNQPFIVHTKAMQTCVYGTEFDVKAYPESTPSVILVSGSIGVKSNDEPSTWERLTPGKMAQLTDKDMQVQTVDTYPLTQWRNGLFYFNDTEIANIMMELGKWYNVSIVFDNEDAMHRRLHFVAEKKEGIANIIKSLNQLGVIKASYNGEQINVK